MKLLQSADSRDVNNQLYILIDLSELKEAAKIELSISKNMMY